MEEFKTTKPIYSQACERLYTRIVDLIMPNGELNPNLQDHSMQPSDHNNVSARLRWKDQEESVLTNVS